MRSRWAGALLLSAFVGSGAMAAGWGDDPAVNTPVATAVGDDAGMKTVHDGSGGYFVVWRNQTTTSVYLQRFGPDGVAMWADDLVVAAVGYAPKIGIDGKGGCIVLWTNNSYQGLYAQRVDGDGDALWGDPVEDGLLVFDPSVEVGCGHIVPDNGGCFVTSYYGVMQRISPAGELLWGDASTPKRYADSVGGDENSARSVSDGSGGIVVVWYDWNSYSGVFAQRVDKNGNRLWNEGYPQILSQSGNALCPRVIKSGSYVYAIWRDEIDDGSVTYEGIRAQKLSMSGVRQWKTINGAIVSDIVSSDTNAHGLAAAPSGGLYVTFKSDDDGQIYAVRLGGDGVPLWEVAISTVANNSGQTYVYPMRKVVEDGSGGMITVWRELYDTNKNTIKTQRLNKDGEAVWGDDVVVTAAAATAVGHISVETNGTGGTVVLWQDNRNHATTGYDVFMQGITKEGELGAPVFTASSSSSSGCAAGAEGSFPAALALFAAGLAIVRRRFSA